MAILSLVVVVIVWYGLSHRGGPATPTAPTTATTTTTPAAPTAPTTATNPLPAVPQPVPKPKFSAGEQQAVQEALQALRALQSVTQVGVTYQDYMRRLGDTKIAVDRASDGVKEPELRSSIVTAMFYYEKVGSLWNAKIQKYDLAGYFRSAAGDCPEAKELLDRDRSDKYPGIELEVRGVQTMMACASHKLADFDQRVQDMK